MKQISFWAKNHIWPSRLLIITIHILLIVLAGYTGILLNELNIIIPTSCFIVVAIFTIMLWLNYPKHTRTSAVAKSSRSYYRRKLYDFSLGLTGFLLIVFAANKPALLSADTKNVYAKIVPGTIDTTLNNHPLIQDFIASIKSNDVSKLNEKEKLGLIKKQIKTIKHSKDTTPGQKTLLIILSIIIALTLLMCLAALACSAACAGSGALAILLFAGGGFLTIFFLVRIIKNISHPRTKKEPELKKTEVSG